MRSIGLDIGTTTICAVVLDGETGLILETVTRQNDSFIKSPNVWERIQDSSLIMEQVTAIISDLAGKYAPIASIGLAGQMHGIVYIDGEGAAVSPLYTWQDGRGDLPYKDGLSYAAHLSKATGYKSATGFGAVTHFYNSVNNLVPESARYFCTIHDYAAMKLGRAAKPLLHPSNAASIGLYDMEGNGFDARAISAAGMDAAFFPEVSKVDALVGTTKEGVPVAVTLGDNQASFMGAVKSSTCLSVNIGTSSQISVFTDKYGKDSRVDIRPYAGDGFLLVGSPLCGGRSYALLEGFFRSVVQMATGKDCGRLYDSMDALAFDFASLENKLRVSTRFSGTRENPALRGSITNLGTDNFTAQHFIVGVLQGIVEELYGFYEEMKPLLSAKPDMLVCSGNGVRLNKPLQKIISAMFRMPVSIPVYKEEAAYGAALYAFVAGGLKSLTEVQALIRYE